MRLQESGEMYLETIYTLSQTKNIVRSIDVVEHMGYSKPSVSRAVNLLKQGGYLTVEDTGNLRLTEEGLQIAQKIYSDGFNFYFFTVHGLYSFPCLHWEF